MDIVNIIDGIKDFFSSYGKILQFFGLGSFLFATIAKIVLDKIQKLKQRSKLAFYVNRRSSISVIVGSNDVAGLDKTSLDNLIKKTNNQYVDFFIDDVADGVCSEVSALKFISKYNQKSKCVLILADSGFGKTSFMIKLHLTINKAQLFPLSTYASIAELKEDISNRLTEVKQTSYDTTLLLDEFDEYAVAWDNSAEAFRELYELRKKYKLVVITCRSLFYTKGINWEEPEEEGNVCIKHLIPYTNKQIKQFLKQKYGGRLICYGNPAYYVSYNFIFKNKYLNAKSLCELFKRPFMLSIIDDVKKSLEAGYRSKYLIYQYCAKSWIERELSQKESPYISLDGEPSNKDLAELKKNLYILLNKFMEEVAALMLKKQDQSVFISEISSSINIDFPKITRCLFSSIKKPSNFSLLVRNGKTLQFCHRSFMEYFLAEYLYSYPEAIERGRIKSFVLTHEEAVGFYYQKLWVTFCKIEKPSYLCAIYSFKDLVDVSCIEFSTFNDIDLEIITHLRDVTELIYTGYDTNLVDLNALIKLHGLATFNLKGLPVSDDNLLQIIENNPNIKLLNIANTSISNVIILQALKNMHFLRNLDISGTYFINEIFQLDCSDTIEAIKFLFSKGVDVETVNFSGLTFFLLATEISSLQVVKALFDCGVNLEAKDRQGWTCLHLAAHDNKLDVVSFLVEKCANLETKSDSGWTPLHLAASHNELGVVSFIVKKGANLEAKSNTGWTPLLAAADSNELDVVRFLVENGADIEAKSDTGWTPLLAAADMNKLDVVKFIVENGADLEAKSNAGWTPLHLAAAFNNLDVVKFLVENGADIEAKSDSGWTPLLAAAKSNELDVVRFLVEKGANIEANNDTGWTPLLAAAEGTELDQQEYSNETHNTLEIDNNKKVTNVHIMNADTILDPVNSLVDRGDGVEDFNYKYSTHQHNKNKSRSLDVVKFLVDNGANIEVKNDKGWTPLHIAAQSYSFDVVKFLVDNGANIEVKNDEGWTPLYVAAHSYHFDVVTFLIEKGANIEEKNKEGLTLLHVAVRSNDIYMVKLLVENGANLNAKDNKNLTPLAYAIILKNYDIEKYLFEMSDMSAGENIIGVAP